MAPLFSVCSMTKHFDRLDKAATCASKTVDTIVDEAFSAIGDIAASAGRELAALERKAQRGCAQLEKLNKRIPEHIRRPAIARKSKTDPNVTEYVTLAFGGRTFKPKAIVIRRKVNNGNGNSEAKKEEVAREVATNYVSNLTSQIQKDIEVSEKFADMAEKMSAKSHKQALNWARIVHRNNENSQFMNQVEEEYEEMPTETEEKFAGLVQRAAHVLSAAVEEDNIVADLSDAETDLEFVEASDDEEYMAVDV